jgi:hypothetical protein
MWELLTHLVPHPDELNAALVEKGVLAREGGVLRHFWCPCTPGHVSQANIDLRNDIDDAIVLARRRTVERN